KLAKRPKPYKINVLLELDASGWSLIQKEVLAKFCNCKNPETSKSNSSEQIITQAKIIDQTHGN
ncbi:9695_t:CDS:2, partial [Entrophospora sp. SA101]